MPHFDDDTPPGAGTHEGKFVAQLQTDVPLSPSEAQTYGLELRKLPHDTLELRGSYDDLFDFLTTEAGLEDDEAEGLIGEESDFDHNEDIFADAEARELSARTAPNGRPFEGKMSLKKFLEAPRRRRGGARASLGFAIPEDSPGYGQTPAPTPAAAAPPFEDGFDSNEEKGSYAAAESFTPTEVTYYLRGSGKGWSKPKVFKTLVSFERFMDKLPSDAEVRTRDADGVVSEGPNTEMRRKIVSESVDPQLLDRANEWVGEHHPGLYGDEFDAKVREVASKLAGQDGEQQIQQLVQSTLKSLLSEGPDDYYAPDICPMCGQDHQHATTACDYEECGQCGFDHTYEPEAALAWHSENDREQDYGPRDPLHAPFVEAAAPAVGAVTVDDELEVGDVVDVDTEHMGTVKVRVIELVPDVRDATGYMENDPTARHPGDDHMDVVYQGPGFVGDIDPESGESGELVFSLGQVVPNSKLKYSGVDYVDNDKWTDPESYGTDADKFAAEDQFNDPKHSDYFDEEGGNAAVPWRAKPFGEAYSPEHLRRAAQLGVPVGDLCDVCGEVHGEDVPCDSEHNDWGRSHSPIAQESTDFGRFMDKILIQEDAKVQRPAQPDSLQRIRAARYQDRPNNKIRMGTR